MKSLKTFLQEDGSRRYQVLAPNFIADREDYPHYEKDRFLSMEMNLNRGDILFDIGAETGWQSAIYAQFVGGESMCLFEHVPELWPTIRQVWEANGLACPELTICGFVSNRDTVAIVNHRKWPDEAGGKLLEDFSTWSRIHANTTGGEFTIDKLVQISKVIPKALTIDVEGAEHRVLSGAKETLKICRPLAWVSVHPKVRLEKFGASLADIRDLMKDCGYLEQYLGVDHEEHWFFYPNEREIVLVDSPWMTNATRHETFEEKIPNWKDSMGMPYASTWGKP